VLQTHPRDDETIPLTGVFRTRSSDRPNPGRNRQSRRAVGEARAARRV